MSRIIKFRGWDTQQKKMWSAEEMGHDELALNPDGRGFVNVSGDNVCFSEYMPHVIPLQFVGLHDKAGREIYEGDIVKCWYNEHYGVLPAQIIWDRTNARFARSYELPSGGGAYCGLDRPDLEVIGNIHEHGHLLENVEVPHA